MTSPAKPRVIVAVCTFNRHEPLRVLLDALLLNATDVGDSAAVGVVVVDDSSDGNAEHIVESYGGRFELGVHYRISGRQNISSARNLAVSTAATLGDWVAMTDDDCEPCPTWLRALLVVQRAKVADAVCGRYRKRVGPKAPAWIRTQPFLEMAVSAHDDGAALEAAGTNNSMLSARWWTEHPDVRFNETLGVVGGEDMVFYRSAFARGLKIFYAIDAVVYENEPPSRATFRYQLRLFLWLGNSSYVVRRSLREAHPIRMFLQGGNQILKAGRRSTGRVLAGEPPQIRYCLALMCLGLGLMLGPVGVRLEHK